MRQGSNNRNRNRNRNHGGGNHGNNGGRRQSVPPRMQTYDSSGPGVRIRGNAYQVHEKYVALASDAAAAGDHVLAESHHQHAEHYQRIINSFAPPVQQTPVQPAEGKEAPQQPEQETTTEKTPTTSEAEVPAKEPSASDEKKEEEASVKEPRRSRQSRQAATA